MNLTEVVEKKIEQLPPPEKKAAAQQPEVKTVKLTTIEIVDKDKIVTPPPSVSELDKANIGTETRDGIEFTGEVSKPGPEVIAGSTGILDVPIVKEPDIFTEVAIPAKFLGNWRMFLERNLNANIPVDNGAEPGRYTILIQFVVDSEGNVSDLRPLTNLGYGMEEEAMRVLKKAKGWEPAIQNGLRVKAYHKQPITFEVLGDS
ncbi:MAG: energy transducer TonB [Chitinophagaceae bacterium]|nr:energy transducer TonB [Chitinophagaceae bacterium]